MKRAQDRVVAARPYALALRDVISTLYSDELAERFPLLRQPEAPRRTAVLLLTSNRGLAGAFNTNVLKEVRTLLQRLEREGKSVDLHVVGRKGIGFFRYLGRTLAATHTDIGDAPSSADAARLVDGLMADFAAGAIDEVYLVYAQFKSALSTPPVAERVLPITRPAATVATRDYLLYPSPDEILSTLLPAYVRNSVYRALVESTAGFYSAQRTAMKNATDNAGEMLTLLRRTYNRARQAQITQEIAEIVGGAAALTG
jgi:F-type H+-transporting ATPase subunit gamma